MHAIKQNAEYQQTVSTLRNRGGFFLEGELPTTSISIARFLSGPLMDDCSRLWFPSRLVVSTLAAGCTATISSPSLLDPFVLVRFLGRDGDDFSCFFSFEAMLGERVCSPLPEVLDPLEDMDHLRLLEEGYGEPFIESLSGEYTSTGGGR